jgi:hypothetical protein
LEPSLSRAAGAVAYYTAVEPSVDDAMPGSDNKATFRNPGSGYIVAQADREGAAKSMNRSVRLVSILRWTAVAMHTALVVSMGIALATTGDSRIEPAANNRLQMFVMLLDFPATILTVPLFALKVAAFTPGSLAVRTIYVLVGGLQWYLIASLLARWTCGFQKTIPLNAKRFGLAVMLGLLLVCGCGAIPWCLHLGQSLHLLAIVGYDYEPADGDATSAAKAKDAIIELVRAKQVDFCWAHANADEMAKLPLNKFDDGEYYFGPFHVNLREHTYYAYLGFTDEHYDYRGTFQVVGRRWKALPPELTRSRILRDKIGRPASSGSAHQPQSPAGG